MKAQLSEPIEIAKAILCDPYKHATKDPMFCVEVKRRDIGIESDWADGTVYVNKEESGFILDAEEKQRLLDDVNESFDEDEWYETGYRDRWEFVQAFLTEVSARAYIATNSHRHGGELRIFVESFYRNYEMQAIRQFLMDMGDAK